MTPQEHAQELAKKVMAKYSPIVETGIAYTQAEAVCFKLRGYEQSTLDESLWFLRERDQ